MVGCLMGLICYMEILVRPHYGEAHLRYYTGTIPMPVLTWDEGHIISKPCMTNHHDGCASLSCECAICHCQCLCHTVGVGA